MVVSDNEVSPDVSVVLLVEEEVLIRLSLAEYLRHCGFWVIEAASANEAKSILLADEKVDIILCDAQQASVEGGFAFAQWVRRRRANVTLMLAATIAGKARAASELCDKRNADKLCEHPHLANRIEAMMARRARKTRGQSTGLRVRTRRF